MLKSNNQSEKYTKEDLRQIAEGLVEKLRECEDGTVTTTGRLAAEAGYEQDDFGEWGLFDLHDVLLRTAKAHHIKLDMSAHEGREEGLPYNLDFVVHNKNAQIKCPHCGSTDTARYIYGYPLYNEEMKNKLEAGKWILGGCCIDTVEVNGEPVNMMATRKCNKCKKGFGTPPVHYSAKKDLADDYRDIVRSISFSEGGFFPGYTTIDIKKKPDGAIVKVDRMIQDGFIQERRISEAKWQEILNRLYCEYYLHEWKKKYDDPYILDGTQWCLEVRFSGDSIGRGFRHYSGSNAFPPYWNEVKKIFWQFLKK